MAFNQSWVVSLFFVFLIFLIQLVLTFLLQKNSIFCEYSFGKIYKTRLLGRFVPIFFFNCEHFFFVYIVKTKSKKSNFVGGKILKIWSSITFPEDMCRPHKILARSQFSRFDVYWILTNRQTKRQVKFIYLYINLACLSVCLFVCIQ